MDKDNYNKNLLETYAAAQSGKLSEVEALDSCIALCEKLTLEWANELCAIISGFHKDFIPCFAAVLDIVLMQLDYSLNEDGKSVAADLKKRFKAVVDTKEYEEVTSNV